MFVSAYLCPLCSSWKLSSDDTVISKPRQSTSLLQRLFRFSFLTVYFLAFVGHYTYYGKDGSIFIALGNPRRGQTTPQMFNLKLFFFFWLDFRNFDADRLLAKLGRLRKEVKKTCRSFQRLVCRTCHDVTS